MAGGLIVERVRIVLHNIKHLAISIDQVLHMLIFMVAKPFTRHYGDETISSHCWRLYQAGVKWPKRLIDGLLFWDKDHCRESAESEKSGSQLPPELRQKD